MTQATTPFAITQAIDIDCSATKAVDFMNDARQWLPWAMLQVESVQPLPFGQWLVKTPAGFTKLRPRYDAAHGVLDYELINSSTEAWHVPVRVVPTPTGCHLAITFVKPERLPQGVFESGLQHSAQGLHTLKRVLEQA